MSGVEVIGVVLGAIPLVISALEHYAEGVKTIKIVRKAELEFRALARKLEAEHLILRNTLTNLLNDCADIRAATLRSLMDDIGAAGWKEPDVKSALEQRLGESLNSYYKHVQSISEALDTFKSRLYLQSSGKVSF